MQASVVVFVVTTVTYNCKILHNIVPGCLKTNLCRIHEATGIDMSTDVYEMLGYDHGEKKVKMVEIS
jgi:hypothetical protein